MTDIVSQKTRSRMMSGIRNKDTAPEMIIRRGLHKRGYRYRLHSAALPGKPDLVLKKHEAVIFVNGCFWHGHECRLFKWPRTRAGWWRQKISRTRERDAENILQLKSAQWRVMVIWECALKGADKLSITQVIDTLDRWLESGSMEGCIRCNRE